MSKRLLAAMGLTVLLSGAAGYLGGYEGSAYHPGPQGPQGMEGSIGVMGPTGPPGSDTPFIPYIDRNLKCTISDYRLIYDPTTGNWFVVVDSASAGLQAQCSMP